MLSPARTGGPGSASHVTTALIRSSVGRSAWTATTTITRSSGTSSPVNCGGAPSRRSNASSPPSAADAVSRGLRSSPIPAGFGGCGCHTGRLPRCSAGARCTSTSCCASTGGAVCRAGLDRALVGHADSDGFHGGVGIRCRERLREQVSPGPAPPHRERSPRRDRGSVRWWSARGARSGSGCRQRPGAARRVLHGQEMLRRGCRDPKARIVEDAGSCRITAGSHVSAGATVLRVDGRHPRSPRGPAVGLQRSCDVELLRRHEHATTTERRWGMDHRVNPSSASVEGKPESPQ